MTLALDLESPAGLKISTGTASYRKMSFALFLGGFATFSLLYCVQPLLPEFADTFHLTPAQSSLALSVTTGTLAFAIMVAGAFSQSLGRRGVMFASMGLAAICNIAAAMAPSWPLLLTARALEGLVLGGVPAVAMAYIAEEMEPKHLGSAMGLYIAGTAFGAMMGRVGMGVLTEFGSWRMALGVIGVLDLVAALAFVWLLPQSRHFVRETGVSVGFHLRAWGAHLRNPRLRTLYAAGFALTGIFVTLFNYAGFRLKAEPYALSQTESSLIFFVFAFGVLSSSLAGKLADRYGSRRLLVAGFAVIGTGIVLSLFQALPLVVAGVALVTIGFFIAHSVTSGWVGRLAGASKGHAASLYLLFYYLGSSVIGSAGGWFWQHGGWGAVAGLAGVLAVSGAALALSLNEEARAGL